MKKCKYKIKDDNGNVTYQCERVPWKSGRCYLHDHDVPTTVKIRRAFIENGETFIKVDLIGAYLKKAELDNADFTEAKLNDADLSWAQLNNADFKGAELNNADLSWAQLNNADLVVAELNNAKLSLAKLNEANLSGAQLNNADLSQASLNYARIFKAELNSANLSWAKLNNAQLYKSELINAQFIETELNGTQLQQAKLNNANLSEAKLKKVNLLGARLNNADLSGVQLNSVDLIGAQLHGANLTNTYGKEGKKVLYPENLILDVPTASYIKNHYKDNGLFKLSDHFYVKQMSCQRKQEPKLKQPLYFLWWLTSRYGVSVWRWVATSIILAFTFGLIFHIFPDLIKYHYKDYDSPFTAFYYSIVTFTTLGFGDVTPNSFIGELLVTFEVILGYIMLGGLIAIFAKKFIRN